MNIDIYCQYITKGEITIMATKIYKPKEFASMLGVSIRTLQRWDDAGILPANRTPGNRRYYTEEQYQNYIEETKAKPAT